MPDEKPLSEVIRKAVAGLESENATLKREVEMLTGKEDAVHLGAQAALSAMKQMEGLQQQLAAEREALAQFMIRNSFATGHGDSHADLLGELEPQVDQLRQQIASARVCDCIESPVGHRKDPDEDCLHCHGTGVRMDQPVDQEPPQQEITELRGDARDWETQLNTLWSRVEELGLKVYYDAEGKPAVRK